MRSPAGMLQTRPTTPNHATSSSTRSFPACRPTATRSRSCARSPEVGVATAAEQGAPKTQHQPTLTPA
eukprot:7520585-Alexandrium_andersonii.AAC.1